MNRKYHFAFVITFIMCPLLIHSAEARKILEERVATLAAKLAKIHAAQQLLPIARRQIIGDKLHTKQVTHPSENEEVYKLSNELDFLFNFVSSQCTIPRTKEWRTREEGIDIFLRRKKGFIHHQRALTFDDALEEFSICLMEHQREYEQSLEKVEGHIRLVEERYDQ